MAFELDLINIILLSFSLVFIFEGILYSLFPYYMKKVAIFILKLSSDKIRFIGFILCLIGIIILYFI
ncbi:MAG: DUF2065 domain-containing protein [Flavobacteriaceae bacterium]|nr:DUF2065 domain-containing protein [Flavobacteriaceae bacterium]